MTIDGFIVHSFLQNSRGLSRLCHVGRIKDGRTFAVVENHESPRYFVRSGDAVRATQMQEAPAELQEVPFTTMDGEAVLRRRCRTAAQAQRESSSLSGAGVRHYEADLPLQEASLLDRGVRGSVRVTGAEAPGRFVDLVFVDPALTPGEWDPKLSVLSFDIETNPETEEILAIGMAPEDPWCVREPVVMVTGTGQHARETGEMPSPRFLPDERTLLEQFVQQLREWDPDLITGWNVIDFDFAVVFRRLAAHRIAADFSRAAMPARFLPADRDRSGRRQDAGVSLPGRHVVDGLRLLRYGPERFDDRRLDAVAKAVLGTGKTVVSATSREKIDTLLSLYRDDPIAFARYCLTDAQLVLQILDKTGLLALTLKRAALTGIGISKAWTSIPGFEFLYIEALHNKGKVAPSLGVDLLPAGEAPGGAILTPVPGIHHHVLVFDFKSLYPSVIRTFNIDPAGYRGNEPGYRSDRTPPVSREQIVAPNGARFSREPGILPGLIDQFWQERDAAKQRDDPVASYVYKIVMNSFYGVLGAASCRFAGAALAGAITSFGQFVLRWSRDWFAQRGLRVLYGDTDSLFINHPDGDPYGGAHLAQELNRDLAAFVQERFATESRLELEYEKRYSAFYLPRIRSAGPAVEIRGRAKGYAGLIAEGPQSGSLEIKGMEAVRSDWTELAAELQRGLLARVLSGAPQREVAEFVRNTIGRLTDGALDEHLVYAKRLRKGAHGYTKSRPPHVQAAMLLPPEEREGTIRYLITTAGPQPESRLSAAIDYGHYVDHQLRPIVEPVCDLIGLDASDLLDPAGQLRLF
jgi:DNA polymerase II